MGVHAAGTGSTWQEDSPDIDQPQGLDYREFQDIRRGVRKRMEKGHQAFGDSTVGGEHIPGGAGVLAMEVTDDGGDITAPVVSDGTYKGRGLVWAWDGSQDARLWCSTEAAESTAATDFTLLYLNPDKQWGGRDVTWTGAHEFDASVDISGNVTIEGDLTLEGKFLIDSSADFSDVFIEGDLSIAGTLKVATDFTLTGDMAVDGTSNFYDEVDFSSFNASGVVAFLSAVTNEDSDGNAMLAAHAYLAQSDGEVGVWLYSATAANILNGWIGFTTDPAGAGTKVRSNGGSDGGLTLNITFLVAKGEYFEITKNTGTPNIFWRSFGALSKPVDQD